MSEIITAEAAKFLSDTDEFLKNTVVNVEITSPMEAMAARTVGNELQKLHTKITHEMSAASAELKTQLAEIQEPFKERLKLVKEKKDHLAIALDFWDITAEGKRRALQVEAETELGEMAPVVVLETPEMKKGVRHIGDPQITVHDLSKFLHWCITNNELQFVLLDEKKLTNRAKEKEGLFEAPGIRVEILRKTSFTGR